MSEIEERIKEIKRLRNNKAQREWTKNHPEKRKELNAKWNTLHRNEYQRQYRLKKKDGTLISTFSC